MHFLLSLVLLMLGLMVAGVAAGPASARHKPNGANQPNSPPNNAAVNNPPPKNAPPKKKRGPKPPKPPKPRPASG